MLLAFHHACLRAQYCFSNTVWEHCSFAKTARVAAAPLSYLLQHQRGFQGRQGAGDLLCAMCSVAAQQWPNCCRAVDLGYCRSGALQVIARLTSSCHHQHIVIGAHATTNQDSFLRVFTNKNAFLYLKQKTFVPSQIISYNLYSRAITSAYYRGAGESLFLRSSSAASRCSLVQSELCWYTTWPSTRLMTTLRGIPFVSSKNVAGSCLTGQQVAQGAA